MGKVERLGCLSWRHRLQPDPLPPATTKTSTPGPRAAPSLNRTSCTVIEKEDVMPDYCTHFINNPRNPRPLKHPNPSSALPSLIDSTTNPSPPFFARYYRQKTRSAHALPAHTPHPGSSTPTPRSSRTPITLTSSPTKGRPFTLPISPSPHCHFAPLFIHSASSRQVWGADEGVHLRARPRGMWEGNGVFYLRRWGSTNAEDRWGFCCGGEEEVVAYGCGEECGM